MTGIIYGSTTGNTEQAAGLIADKLSNAETKSVDTLSSGDFENYDFLILGASTWGAGDLQDDWEAALETFKAANLKAKGAALFGLGDQDGYPDTFQDALKPLYDILKEKGIPVYGFTSTEGYNFEESAAVEGDQFIGLVLDSDNEEDLTESRIEAWVDNLKKEAGV